MQHDNADMQSPAKQLLWERPDEIRLPLSLASHLNTVVSEVVFFFEILRSCDLHPLSTCPPNFPPT
jgi:hypothetical protein